MTWEIMPGLYQGSARYKSGFLAAHGVQAIVNLSDVPGIHGDEVCLPTFKWHLTDGPSLPDVAFLHLLVDFVTRCVRQGRPVLVHCSEGVNRSGLVTALVVRQLTQCTGLEAVSHVRRQRPGALTNPTFAQWLESLPAPARGNFASEDM